MKTAILKIDKDKFDPLLLRGAVDILRAGGLVAFPTETVYGIAVDARNEESLQKLNRIKRRPQCKHYTYHIADLADFTDYVHRLPIIAKMLIRRYWPGPLTLVLNSGDDEPVGVRYPACRISRELIRQAAIPIVATSANLTEKAPSVTAQDVQRYFGDRLDYIIDGGRTEYGQSSTVVRVEDRTVSVLREGFIPAAELISIDYKDVIFVCTGNMCRSPIAEAMTKGILARRLSVAVAELEELGFYLHSAGVAAPVGSPASQNAQAIIAEYAFDLTSHRATQLSPGLIHEADTIFALNKDHKRQIEELAPEAASKVRLIVAEGIPDPIGRGMDFYRKIAGEIFRQTPEIAEIILGEKK